MWIIGVWIQGEDMSNRAHVLGVGAKDSPKSDPSAASGRPRRIRLAKAMVATGRAMEAPTPATESLLFHARSCKLSKEDEARLDMLKRRLGSQGIQAKKSQLLRAALWVLAEFDDDRLRDAVRALDHAEPMPLGLSS